MGAIVESLGINFKVTALQIVAFTVLFIVLWRFLFSRVVGALTQREDEIQGMMHQVQSKQAKVEEQMNEYARRLKEIEHDATLKIQEAVTEAQRIKGAVEADARKRAEEDLERGKVMIRREMEQAMANARAQASRLAVEIADRILVGPRP